jgi:hypothetical protein
MCGQIFLARRGDVAARTCSDRTLSLRCDYAGPVRFERHSAQHSACELLRLAHLYELWSPNRFTVGLIPTFGYNEVSNGPGSAGGGAGDLTTQAQYRFTQFREGTWVPTTSVAAQETLRTGKYDRLGDRLSGGFGAGSYSTTVAFYSQTYFWLPNGRILRMRFNVWPAFSRSVKIEDVRSTVPTQDFASMPNPVAHSSSMRPGNTALHGAGCWNSRPGTVTRATLL